MSSTSATLAQITVNGEARPLGDSATLATLVADLALDARQVAVELNRAIVSRSRYADTALHDGDAVEIVRFIGGG